MCGARSEHILQRVLRKIARNERLADALEQDQSQAALLDLLVEPHQFQVARDTQGRR
jgi:hypothetical protein